MGTLDLPDDPLGTETTTTSTQGGAGLAVKPRQAPSVRTGPEVPSVPSVPKAPESEFANAIHAQPGSSAAPPPLPQQATGSREVHAAWMLVPVDPSSGEIVDDAGEGAVAPGPAVPPPPTGPAVEAPTKRKNLGLVLGLTFILIGFGVGGTIGVVVWRRGQEDPADEPAPFAFEAVDVVEPAEPEAPKEEKEWVPSEAEIQAMYAAAAHVDWPVIVLTGMVSGGPRDHKSAILNGVLIAIRQTIQGAHLVEVQPDGVVLQYLRTRKYIRVGEST